MVEWVSNGDGVPEIALLLLIIALDRQRSIQDQVEGSGRLLGGPNGILDALWSASRCE